MFTVSDAQCTYASCAARPHEGHPSTFGWRRRNRSALPRAQDAHPGRAATRETLLTAIDANDADTGAHVRRVASYALIIGEAAGLDEHTLHSIERVALFHDIATLHGALNDIFHDPRKLTPGGRA